MNLKVYLIGKSSQLGSRGVLLLLGKYLTAFTGQKQPPEVFCKKNFLRNFASLFLNKVAGVRSEACNLIKKKTLAQVFSYEFSEISKNTSDGSSERLTFQVEKLHPECLIGEKIPCGKIVPGNLILFPPTVLTGPER